MLVQAIMTSPAITVTASASVAEAARLMLDNRISGLPVVDANGALVGIVSEGVKDQLVWVDPYYGIALPPPDAETRQA
ncbi:CBS domain-containing protein (plasmid) [Rhizobium phaseoli]|uniref:CBS domain-containing protein n=1 Tax=Rhizobium phaseoli TaxID=396 RepID=A0ABM6CGF1_9HYPH|nr:CBS domain-containing protein [Rhizobium phaseoli]ANL42944.1 CBS domain-containing protein [Rhizobium phaseoli]ANL55624.1 CBS domain-containing protein [Rhizobium phaseoli]ANL61930.1 CBS domain-containing protein [Rhizobium phaseoli]ANL87343.1 CBS domain-containing protein [Rhizobium phaseoli]